MVVKKIVVTHPIHTPVLEHLQSVAHVVMNPGPEPWPFDILTNHLSDADAMMAFMPDRMDRALLALAPKLSTIACALKGYDNFDLQACAERGVTVSFVPDLLTEPTAELAVALAIAAARHVVVGDERVRQGFHGWRPTLYGTGLHQSVVSVVGLGAVGRAILDRLQGFGCQELLGVDPKNYDNRVKLVDLQEALERSNFVILAVPLVENTRHLINEESLRVCKPGQILINIGRGSVVDEAAVARQLESGFLGAYAADVFEMEDWLLTDRPRGIHPDLLRSKSTVFTPHLGSAVARVRLAIEWRAAENLLRALDFRLNTNQAFDHDESILIADRHRS